MLMQANLLSRPKSLFLRFSSSVGCAALRRVQDLASWVQDITSSTDQPSSRQHGVQRVYCPPWWCAGIWFGFPDSAVWTLASGGSFVKCVIIA